MRGKDGYYAWTSVGKILTMEILRDIVVISWYCMCKRRGESVDHLLLHYETASATWSNFFSPIKLAWSCPQVVYLFYPWKGLDDYP